MSLSDRGAFQKFQDIHHIWRCAKQWRSIDLRNTYNPHRKETCDGNEEQLWHHNWPRTTQAMLNNHKRHVVRSTLLWHLGRAPRSGKSGGLRYLGTGHGFSNLSGWEDQRNIKDSVVPHSLKVVDFEFSSPMSRSQHLLMCWNLFWLRYDGGSSNLTILISNRPDMIQGVP